jgi:hypothetical protein
VAIAKPPPRCWIGWADDATADDATAKAVTAGETAAEVPMAGEIAAGSAPASSLLAARGAREHATMIAAARQR